jgi:hypothetical protein
LRPRICLGLSAALAHASWNGWTLRDVNPILVPVDADEKLHIFHRTGPGVAPPSGSKRESGQSTRKRRNVVLRYSDYFSGTGRYALPSHLAVASTVLKAISQTMVNPDRRCIPMSSRLMAGLPAGYTEFINHLSPYVKGRDSHQRTGELLEPAEADLEGYLRFIDPTHLFRYVGYNLQVAVNAITSDEFCSLSPDEHNLCWN